MRRPQRYVYRDSHLPVIEYLKEHRWNKTIPEIAEATGVPPWKVLHIAKGNHITFQRLKLGFTQAEFIKRCGIDRYMFVYSRRRGYLKPMAKTSNGSTFQYDLETVRAWVRARYPERDFRCFDCLQPAHGDIVCTHHRSRDEASSRLPDALEITAVYREDMGRQLREALMRLRQLRGLERQDVCTGAYLSSNAVYVIENPTPIRFATVTRWLLNARGQVRLESGIRYRNPREAGGQLAFLLPVIEQLGYTLALRIRTPYLEVDPYIKSADAKAFLTKIGSCLREIRRASPYSLSVYAGRAGYQDRFLRQLETIGTEGSRLKDLKLLTLFSAFKALDSQLVVVLERRPY